MFTGLRLDGYQGTKAIRSRVMEIYFDDELDIVVGRKGKADAMGALYSDSFSILVCFQYLHTKSQAIVVYVIYYPLGSKKMTREQLEGVCLQSEIFSLQSMIKQTSSLQRSMLLFLPFLFSNSFWLGSKDQMYQNFNILFNTLISFSSFF
jgi:hypothetical protein